MTPSPLRKDSKFQREKQSVNGFLASKLYKKQKCINVVSFVFTRTITITQKGGQHACGHGAAARAGVFVCVSETDREDRDTEADVETDDVVGITSVIMECGS